MTSFILISFRLSFYFFILSILTIKRELNSSQEFRNFLRESMFDSNERKYSLKFIVDFCRLHFNRIWFAKDEIDVQYKVRAQKVDDLDLRRARIRSKLFWAKIVDEEFLYIVKSRAICLSQIRSKYFVSHTLFLSRYTKV